MAVGSLTIADRQNVGAGAVRYTILWSPAHPSGEVNGHADLLAAIQSGYLRQIHVAGAGTYVSQLVDANGVDLLGGKGTITSGHSFDTIPIVPPVFYDGDFIDLVVTGANLVNFATMEVWISQTSGVEEE